MKKFNVEKNNIFDKYTAFYTWPFLDHTIFKMVV